MFKGTKVLDVHGHVTAPGGGNGYLQMMMASNSPQPSPIFGGKSVDRPGMTDEEFKKSAQTHVTYMDERDIDVQIIGPRPFQLLGWMEDHLFTHWVNYFNDAIFKQCQAFPNRFLGAATLPQLVTKPDISHVLPELERCVKEYGFVATYVSPDVTGRRDTPGMHEPYWYPLYEYCQKNGLPIIVHGTNALDKRYRVVPHNYQLGFYTEQYLTTQFLGHGDVFQRYPELKVVVCHCGGGLDRFVPSDPHLPQKDLKNNLFFDTCAYDPIFLEAGIKQRGVARMLFGSEAPGSGRHINPATGKSGDTLVPVIDGFSFLTEKDKLDIFHNNPAKFCPAFSKVG